MAFNASTWTTDFSGAPGLKLLGAAAAVRKGYAPKHARDVPAAFKAPRPKAKTFVIERKSVGGKLPDGPRIGATRAP